MVAIFRVSQSSRAYALDVVLGYLQRFPSALATTYRLSGLSTPCV